MTKVLVRMTTLPMRYEGDIVYRPSQHFSKVRMSDEDFLTLADDPISIPVLFDLEGQITRRTAYIDGPGEIYMIAGEVRG